MQQSKQSILISELVYALAIFALGSLVGVLVSLGMVALMEGPLDVLPFWGRRGSTIVFPIYGFGVGLVLGIQEFRAGYANRLALREAQEHLGEQRRIVWSGRRPTAAGGEQVELVLQSADGRRRARLTNTHTAAGDPELFVHLEERADAAQDYVELRRLPLRYTLLERLVGDDTRYFLEPAR